MNVKSLLHCTRQDNSTLNCACNSVSQLIHNLVFALCHLGCCLIYILHTFTFTFTLKCNSVMSNEAKGVKELLTAKNAWNQNESACNVIFCTYNINEHRTPNMYHYQNHPVKFFVSKPFLKFWPMLKHVGSTFDAPERNKKEEKSEISETSNTQNTS